VFVDNLLHLVVEQFDTVIDSRRAVEVVQRRLQNVVLEVIEVDATYVSVLVLDDGRRVARYVQAASGKMCQILRIVIIYISYYLHCN